MVLLYPTLFGLKGIQAVIGTMIRLIFSSSKATPTARHQSPSNENNPMVGLPPELLLRIADFITLTDTLCLKQTCSRLHNAFSTVQLSRHAKPCQAWLLGLRLERDAIDRGEHLERLWCSFCKIRHPVQKFMDKRIAWLGFANRRKHIEGRYCRLHLRKRIEYDATYRDGKQENWAKALRADRWIARLETPCWHCGDIKITNQSGRKVCPACPRDCWYCSPFKAPIRVFTRYGPRGREVKTLNEVSFVRREENDMMVEVEDRCGIKTGRKSRFTVLTYE